MGNRWGNSGNSGNSVRLYLGGLQNQSHAEAETPILWPPDVKSRLIGKDSDAGKD